MKLIRRVARNTACRKGGFESYRYSYTNSLVASVNSHIKTHRHDCYMPN